MKAGHWRLKTSCLWVGGTRQPRKAVHLGEGKPRFLTSVALRTSSGEEKATGVNPECKSGVEPLRQLD